MRVGERKHRSLEERLILHSQTRELRLQGMRHAEIAAALGITPDEVAYWLKAGKPYVQRYTPDLTPRPDLAYLVGAYLGDGRTAGEQDKKVRFKVADIEFANLLNGLVAKVLGANPKPITMERGFYCVDYDCAALYDYLQQTIEAYIPLIEANPNMFLRGFFDAEGYATPVLNHSKKIFAGIMIGVVNTRPEYLDVVQMALASFRIRPRAVTTHTAGDPMTIRGRTFIRKHDVRHLIITRKTEIETFYARIGFSIPDKKNKLEDMVMITRQSRREAYAWFVSNYLYVNRRWIKKQT